MKNTTTKKMSVSKEDILFICTGGYKTVAGIKKNNEEVKAKLLSYFSENNIDELICEGWSALMATAFVGLSYELEILLSLGANANVKCKSNVTALHMAVMNNKADIVKKLLVSGADFEAKTETGLTPFMLAVQNGNEEIVKMLLKKNVDVLTTDEEKKDALEYAIQHDNVIIQQYIERKMIEQDLVNIDLSANRKEGVKI